MAGAVPFACAMEYNGIDSFEGSSTDHGWICVPFSAALRGVKKWDVDKYRG